MSDQPPPMTLDEVTTWLGASIAVDERLFAIVGEWSTDEADAAVRVTFATVSRWLGEHAVEARGLLADSPALAAVDRVALPEAWADRLNRLAGAGTDRASVLAEVLRDRVARDAEVVAGLRAVADGALIRHLARTRLDHDRALSALPAP